MAFARGSRVESIDLVLACVFIVSCHRSNSCQPIQVFFLIFTVTLKLKSRLHGNEKATPTQIVVVMINWCSLKLAIARSKSVAFPWRF